MAECSLFARVPTRCAADVGLGTSKASDNVLLANVYVTKVVKCGINGIGSDEFTGGLVHLLRCPSMAGTTQNLILALKHP